LPCDDRSLAEKTAENRGIACITGAVNCVGGVYSSINSSSSSSRNADDYTVLRVSHGCCVCVFSRHSACVIWWRWRHSFYRIVSSRLIISCVPWRKPTLWTDNYRPTRHRMSPSRQYGFHHACAIAWRTALACNHATVKWYLLTRRPQRLLFSCHFGACNWQPAVFRSSLYYSSVWSLIQL